MATWSLIVAGICTVLAFLLQLLAISTTGWSVFYHVSNGQYAFEKGLWQECTYNEDRNGERECYYFYSVPVAIPGYLQANQGLQLFGFLVLFFGMLVLLAYAFVLRTRRKLAVQTWMATGFISGILILVGVLIYAIVIWWETSSIRLQYLNGEFGYSLGMAIVASVFCFVTGVLGFIETRKAKDLDDYYDN